MLKIGQGVRIKDEPYIGEVGVIDYIAPGNRKYQYRVKLNMGGYTWESDEMVEILPKSWDTLAKGDVVVDEYEDELTVLHVEGDLVDVSHPESSTEHMDTYTKQELISSGFKIKNAEEDTLILSIDQIAEKFGKPVDKIKIKK